jgi:signal transduction histidine kinase
VSRATRWWIVFGACNVVIALALIWTTRVVLDLERSELRARTETDYQESLRLAMWRMDSWLSLLFAREAAQPGVEAESDYITLRFAIDANGDVTIPGVGEDGTAIRRAALDRYRPYLDLPALYAAVSTADNLVDATLADPAQAPVQDEWTRSQRVKTQNEFEARVACSVPRPSGAELAGRQVVAWLDPPEPIGEPILVFLRHTQSGSDKHFQGFVLDWPRLRTRLLFEIRDLFPNSRLERVASAVPVDPLGRGLANIPAVLAAEAPAPVRTTWFSGGRTALAVAWLAAIVAAVAVGVTLQKSIDLGERRRRFVSSVTHELRTPLTTFQLYSEMLADGLVQSEEQRKQYAETLKDESRRLSAMVGNVLAHARIEEGGRPWQIETMRLDEMLARLVPPLERRVDSTPMALEVRLEDPGDVLLAVDVEAIGQILGNLVENAIKYAQPATSSTIHLGAAASNGSLILSVRDHGPGISSDKAKAVFAPFDRGGRDPADPIPGVGLGLALARGLARDMGGELNHESPSDGGALFRLELPATAGSRGQVLA